MEKEKPAQVSQDSVSINDNQKQAGPPRRALGIMGVLWNYTMARILPGAGVQRLISTLDSNNEEASMAAYMALVKLGPNNAAAIVDQINQGGKPSNLLQLLGDIGEPGIIPELEEFAQSPDAEIAEAARASIALLRESEGDET